MPHFSHWSFCQRVVLFVYGPCQIMCMDAEPLCLQTIVPVFASCDLLSDVEVISLYLINSSFVPAISNHITYCWNFRVDYGMIYLVTTSYNQTLIWSRRLWWQNVTSVRGIEVETGTGWPVGGRHDAARRGGYCCSKPGCGCENA